MKHILKIVLFVYVSYYLMRRIKLHFSLSSIGFSLFNKNVLFILLNFVLLFTLLEYNFRGTSVTITNDDPHLEEEFVPYRSSSDAIIIQQEVAPHFIGKNELEEEKSIILVEKYAKEDDLEGGEEENMLDIVYNNFAMKVSSEYDTGWQPNLIQGCVNGLELVVVEDHEVKDNVSIENELDKLDLDALNQKFDEFISIQRRKWQLQGTEQLQLVEI